jgi:hypothetical protein
MYCSITGKLCHLGGPILDRKPLGNNAMVCANA